MADRHHATARFIGSCLLGVLVCASSSRAHEHWIDLDSFYPSPGETDTVYVRSGHYFPKTLLKVSEKVMQGVSVRTPDGQTLTVETEAAKKQWLGTLIPGEQGVHLISFTLKRSRAPKPNYEAKAIVVAGSADDTPDGYALGSGLELIPGKAVSGLKPGDELPVSLALDGALVDGELEIVPENGRSAVAKTSAGLPAVFSLKEPGRYLLTASVEGRGCSLVFQVQESGEESE